MSILRTDTVILSSLLAEFSWLDHGFGTRAFAPPQEIRTLRQVHSARVVAASEHAPDLEADGLISSTPGVLVGVRTADCVPILLADPERKVVAAVHAGWRGTLAGIISEALRRMEEWHGTRTANVRIAIGPSIGVCCYEVGEEVAFRFRGLVPLEAVGNGKTMLDLKEANRRLAHAAGVPEEQIDVLPLCTRCRPTEFHSYRRDKDGCGRLLSFVGVRAERNAAISGPSQRKQGRGSQRSTPSLEDRIRQN